MSARRSSSSSSSSSEIVEATLRARGISETSRETQQTVSHIHEGSATNAVDRTSIGETTTIRSSSPSTSYRSGAATHAASDAASVATTTNTGFSNATAVTNNIKTSQQQSAGGISVIGPPVFPQQPPHTSAVNQPIQVNVTAAHQQYQQHPVQPEISPYSGSSVSSSSGSLSSPGNASFQQQHQQHQQQPRFDAAKAMFTQADTNRDGGISREEFQQWAQGGNQASGQSHFQQQQQQPFNHLLGPDAFKDVVLNIDYGAIEAYNVAFQSGDDFAGGQVPPNSNVGGQRFDVAKAIFSQADTNHDGAISRDEFRQWAQHGQQNSGGQSFSNHQATSESYGNNFNNAQVFAGGNPNVANILQQSGLGQAYQNYR